MLARLRAGFFLDQYDSMPKPFVLRKQMEALGPKIDRSRVRSVASAIRKVRYEIEQIEDDAAVIAETVKKAIEQVGHNETKDLITQLTEGLT